MVGKFRFSFVLLTLALAASGKVQSDETTSSGREIRIDVTIDRGPDVGQSFGSLFEASSDNGLFTIGAGFQNAYNTRYRGDRHAIQFFVRSNRGVVEFQTLDLPRPNDLCGTYLYGRDDIVRSTFGGVRAWDEGAGQWREEASIGGTEESMRVAGKLMQFGDSCVVYDGREILRGPEVGSYQLFFYANGRLCFYHVNRGDGGYRPYADDQDGFSKLYACPWTPDQAHVDLSQAEVMTLPVVGETTFAWGTLGHQIVTGSNIGGFYVFEAGKWKKLLEPQMNVSYQLYSSMAFHDRLLMGQYPTGRLFEYDGNQIRDLPGWPPVPPGVSGSAREAQTTAIYAGELVVGVWPWGELWRYHPGYKKWSFAKRMFEYPEPNTDVTHPYEVENRADPVQNLWGQRITSLIPNRDSLFVATSAKSPVRWEPRRSPFLAPELWKSYGRVYRVHVPGHLSVATHWTIGQTRFQFVVSRDQASIFQDRELLATTNLGDLGREIFTELQTWKHPRWGAGIYGPFNGKSLTGSIAAE